ncbi:hypothetical protein U9M48_002853 [Paspalum notatum var. saurae]|uniref:F-box/LRR-repeat protein n=1 Tax=Paspalum notatum var. saurae TaxID=547442 RepID=A0AAQ3PK78_PASNO
MLRLRGHTPLQVCELAFGSFDRDDDILCLNRWVRHVVMCQIQRFMLENIYPGDAFELDDLLLISQHLSRLELVGIVLNNGFCDFSSCPSLGSLVLSDCYLWDAKKLLSASLKQLCIRSCDFGTEFNTLILVPSLVFLHLDSHLCGRPIFGSMPLLKRAFIRVPHQNNCSSDCDEEDCYSCHHTMDDDKCAFLDGLSNAEKLILVSESTAFIFKSDLKQCPTFTKLKTLLLNGNWCVAPNFSALTCILKNSPVLEELILPLFSKQPCYTWK